MIFRVLLLLMVFGICVSTAAYFWTRQKRYLNYALKLLQIMIVCSLIFFGVMILERIV